MTGDTTDVQQLRLTDAISVSTVGARVLVEMDKLTKSAMRGACVDLCGLVGSCGQRLHEMHLWEGTYVRALLTQVDRNCEKLGMSLCDIEDASVAQRLNNKGVAPKVLVLHSKSKGGPAVSAFMKCVQRGDCRGLFRGVQEFTVEGHVSEDLTKVCGSHVLQFMHAY
jgi:hypothetical protein